MGEEGKGRRGGRGIGIEGGRGADGGEVSAIGRRRWKVRPIDSTN